MSKNTVEKINKDNKKDYRNKKSRVTNLNSASNQRAQKFMQHDSINWLADKKPSKGPKIQKIKDTEEFMLQINPQNKFLSMMELVEKTMLYAVQRNIIKHSLKHK